MTYTDNKLALSGSYLGDIEKILINGQDVKNIGWKISLQQLN